MLPVIEPWHWMAAGVVLAVAETVVPGAILIWIGAAAFLTGIVAYVAPIGMIAQLVLFAVLSVLMLGSVFVLRRRHAPAEEEAPTVNRGAARFVGTRCVLEGPLVDGQGRIKLGDTVWAVTGPDLPDGSHVVVTGMDGATLIVRPV